jgi:hypothetical protein
MGIGRRGWRRGCFLIIRVVCGRANAHFLLEKVPSRHWRCCLLAAIIPSHLSPREHMPLRATTCGAYELIMLTSCQQTTEGNSPRHSVREYLLIIRLGCIGGSIYMSRSNCFLQSPATSCYYPLSCTTNLGPYPKRNNPYPKGNIARSLPNYSLELWWMLTTEENRFKPSAHLRGTRAAFG